MVNRSIDLDHVVIKKNAFFAMIARSSQIDLRPKNHYSVDRFSEIGSMIANSYRASTNRERLKSVVFCIQKQTR